jgi:hypothetical protein
MDLNHDVDVSGLWGFPLLKCPRLYKPVWCMNTYSRNVFAVVGRIMCTTAVMSSTTTGAALASAERLWEAFRHWSMSALFSRSRGSLVRQISRLSLIFVTEELFHVRDWRDKMFGYERGVSLSTAWFTYLLGVDRAVGKDKDILAIQGICDRQSYLLFGLRYTLPTQIFTQILQLSKRCNHFFLHDLLCV